MRVESCTRERRLESIRRHRKGQRVCRTNYIYVLVVAWLVKEFCPNAVAMTAEKSTEDRIAFIVQIRK